MTVLVIIPTKDSKATFSCFLSSTTLSTSPKKPKKNKEKFQNKNASISSFTTTNHHSIFIRFPFFLLLFLPHIQFQMMYHFSSVDFSLFFILFFFFISCYLLIWIPFYLCARKKKKKKHFILHKYGVDRQPWRPFLCWLTWGSSYKQYLKVEIFFSLCVNLVINQVNG